MVSGSVDLMWHLPTPIPVITLPGTYPIHLTSTPDPINASRLDHLVIPYIDRMHEVGIRLNPDRVKHVKSVITSSRSDLQSKIISEFGTNINSKSHKQVAELLESRGIFELGLAEGVFPSDNFIRTESNAYSTRDEVLSLALALDPAIKLLIDARELHTLQSNFVDKLPRYIRKDTGRVHTTFKLASVATGRIASEDPPMQTLPSHSGLSELIRSMFEPSPGYRLVSCDYSQIEMWLAGVLAQDSRLMQIFIDGLDTHTTTASMMFDVPYDKVEKKTHRLFAKTVNFGVLYGMQALALMIRIICSGGPRKTVEDCESYIKRWYGIYTGVHHMLCVEWSKAARFGYTWDISGRIRPCPLATCTDERMREAGQRQAGNSKIQASGAVLIKLAMVLLWEKIKELDLIEPGIVRPLLQIHDELVYEVRDWYAEEWLSTTLTVMKGVDKGVLGLPIGASGAIGGNLGEVK